MDIKEIEKIIKKGEKSKFQNCFQCRYFPKPNKSMYVSVGWAWRVPDVEQLEFRCRYLRKNLSQELKPFQSNHCLCFELKEEE